MRWRYFHEAQLSRNGSINTSACHRGLLGLEMWKMWTPEIFLCSTATTGDRVD
jgi:hypothetical protein